MDPFITLEAWIANGGDGSCSIQWFMPGHDPGSTGDDDEDPESWYPNEGSGTTVEVRRGGSQHQKAWVKAFAPKDDDGDYSTFISVSREPELVAEMESLGWGREDIVSSYNGETYARFSPPTGWETADEGL